MVFAGQRQFIAKAKTLIEDLHNKRFVSIVSIWEIVIKAALGKLEFNSSVNDIKMLLVKNDIQLIGVAVSHLDILQNLPHHHRDPFDRLIIAQAMAEKLSVITADQHFTPYQLDIVAQ